MNDIAVTGGDAKVFKENYKEVLEDIREILPGAAIYINSIFPVQQMKIDESPVYGSLDTFNQTLRELAEEEGVTFIDNTEIVKEEYYEPDGVHMTSEIYRCGCNMAEVAGYDEEDPQQREKEWTGCYFYYADDTDRNIWFCTLRYCFLEKVKVIPRLQRWSRRWKEYWIILI